MTHDTKRTFEESHRLAARLGRALSAIEKHSGYTHYPVLREGAEMERIATAMGVIAATPNASLSRETLEAFDQRIDAAIAGLRGWVSGLLDPGPQFGDEGEGDDEIHF